MGLFPVKENQYLHEMEKKKEKSKVRFTPLNSSRNIQSRIDNFWDESGKAAPRDSVSAEIESGSSPSNARSSAWQSPLLKDHCQANTKATNEAASSAKDRNTAEKSDALHQNPGVSESTTSKSVERRGKNYEKNRRRKERKRLYLGMKNLFQQSQVQGEDIPSSSGVNKRARGSSSTLSTSSTSLPQKRGRIENRFCSPEGTTKRVAAGNSSSYAEVVKTSSQKLVITRKESEGDGTMEGPDLREIQKAITKMILRTDPGFLVRIECIFLHEEKVLMICADEKTFKLGKRDSRVH